MEELARLLGRLFEDADGLRKFLAHEPGGEQLLVAVPKSMPWSATPARAARELVSRGMADAGFFRRLRDQFPAHTEEILTVGEGFTSVSDETLMQAMRLLLDAQLMGLVAELGAPSAEMPSIYAPQSVRAIALFDWVKSQPGARARLEGRLRALVPALFPAG